MVFTGKYQLAGKSFSLPEAVGLQGIAVLTVFLISEWLYRTAMKRFTAVGA